MHPSYHDVVASLRTERIAASEEEERVQEGLDGGWQDTLSLTDLFAAHALTKDARFENSVTLANAHSRYKLAESAYFGVVLNHERERVFLNTHEPFCAVVVGVQGAGKSHSMSVILESCLLSSAALSNEQDTTLITARQPMCALVLHYDQNPSSLCEATGLISPATFKGLNGDVPALPPDNMTVLTSPTFYLQRREFYDGYCDVRPLLFSWDNLSADHIKKLMRIDDNENLLYVATLMALLRKYQRIGQKPSFSDFKREVVALSNIKSQEAPLMQRLNILESFLLESKINEHIRSQATDLSSLVKPGNLISQIPFLQTPRSTPSFNYWWSSSALPPWNEEVKSSRSMKSTSSWMGRRQMDSVMRSWPRFASCVTMESVLF
ncbi:hypothetical protein BC830DRAFT_1106050 [Chytriomyces sp. MP71]|nr:hypothetical protein BC830DRAFT_1106050 [Chytriomyces sp. MP71]